MLSCPKFTIANRKRFLDRKRGNAVADSLFDIPAKADRFSYYVIDVSKMTDRQFQNFLPDINSLLHSGYGRRIESD